MSTPDNSQLPGIKAFVSPTVPSLADILVIVEQMPKGMDSEQANLASALRTVGRVLGLPLADIPAHPGFLQRRLAKVSPVAHGISVGHLSNVRSRLRRTLALGGTAILPGRYLAPLTPAWRGLWLKLTSDRLRYGLSRVMHFASANGMEPEAFDDAAMARFNHALHEESLIRNPKKSARQALTFWNRAVEQVDDWPRRRLTVPDRTDRYALPWSTFPREFVQEVEAWLARLGGVDQFEELDFRPLKPVTVQSRRRQVHELASALVLRGRDPASIRSLADLAKPEAAKEALHFFRERAPGRKPTMRMQHLVFLLIGIAKHWVRADQKWIDRLRIMAKRCAPDEVGMTEKNRATLLAFDSEAAVQRLIQLPQRVAKKVGQGDRLTRRQAHRLETALMVEVLLVAPVRLSNLVSLRLDQHLIRLGGRPEKVLLTFPATEVKNSKELTFELPATTIKLLNLYLAAARPVLATAPSSLLFPGAAGGYKTAPAVESQLGKITHSKVGVRLTPHQFRHVAGKLYLDQEPGGHEVVRALLGHSRIETTLRFYAGMEQAAAVRRYDALLEKLRTEDPDREDE